MHAGRLLLEAGTADDIRAEIDSPGRLGLALDADVPADWPPGEYDRNAQEFFREKMESAGDSGSGWYVWYAIMPAHSGGRRSLIGTGGYLGPPNGEGHVEIGYSVSEAWRGKGLAREMVKGLVDHALADSRVKRVLAHTSAGNAASRSVLEKSGFHLAGPGAEPGTIRYELLK